ncbi:hypothetical protein E4U43_006549 [Claviceps pusilla]|uniref:Uncharacterized protein n=1 Tax=Claviceps pusilla TaxID=123648 RepID=A0A9P7NE32_9HYPO|nr:hypothetical protein E4U43_006549 [Claviceps pusilla]
MPDRNPYLSLPQHLLPRARPVAPDPDSPGSPGSWQAKKRGSINRSHTPYPGGKLLWRTSKTESQSIHVPHTEMFRDLGWSCRAETRRDSTTAYLSSSCPADSRSGRPRFPIVVAGLSPSPLGPLGRPWSPRYQ